MSNTDAGLCAAAGAAVAGGAAGGLIIGVAVCSGFFGSCGSAGGVFLPR